MNYGGTGVFKNVIIGLLLIGLCSMTWLAWRNAVLPSCYVVQSYAGQIYCMEGNQ